MALKPKDELLKDWLAELRNPDNGQTKFHLRNLTSGSRCCIGVLLDCSGIEGAWQGGSDDDNTDEHFGFYPTNRDDITKLYNTDTLARIGYGKMNYVANDDIPGALVEYVLGNKIIGAELAGLNDGDTERSGYRQWSFSEIADYIENKLKGA